MSRAATTQRLPFGSLESALGLTRRESSASRTPPAAGEAARNPLAWDTLPPQAQLYVAAVIGAGASLFVLSFPTSFPHPQLFMFLVGLSCMTSAWKVTLPLSLVSGSTLSVSYAADMAALLLLGPRAAMVVAVAGALMQGTVNVRRRYPAYRNAFNVAEGALTMVSTGVAYIALGGPIGPIELGAIAKPVVGAIATYFVVNTGFIAGVIALSTRRTWWQVWRQEFLWTASSFMVAGSAGALGAVVVQRGEQWLALLMIAPVYLTYRTYHIVVGRLEDQKRHVAETQALHGEAVDALRQALAAERALVGEKERLAVALADMTRLEDARKQLLEREHAARASAEQANRLKDEFLAVVSHELRTPLNAILGWADLLRAGKLDETKRDRASQAIFDSARRQSHLIDELLDIARIMSGKLRLERSPVDLAATITAAIEVVQPAVEAKQIKMVVESDAPVGTVYGDSARLQQVAWNLLSNAVKFTPEGGTVRVALRARENAAEIVITDSGAGIPADFLPSVFEPFRQADGSTTRPHSGLGLGLSIVKHLVEAHGGTVTADSPGHGQGAVFMVRLPTVASAPPRAAEALQSGRPPTDVSLQGLRVLVVDDDEESRHVLIAHLESSRATVLSAGSAAEALDLLQRESVNVLLADIAMPGEDGYSLIRKLRTIDAAVANVPAAALTAFAREEDRQAAFRAGFQLHLAKPIDAGSLIAAVATLGRWNPTTIR
jgi:signal transduction histidine kinase/ActR/RegA family two-component response regulator